MTGRRDAFLSEGDLDLRNLSWDELLAWWDTWLRQAQATNYQDAHLISHGVFTVDPAVQASPPPRERFLQAGIGWIGPASTDEAR